MFQKRYTRIKTISRKDAGGGKKVRKVRISSSQRRLLTHYRLRRKEGSLS